MKPVPYFLTCAGLGLVIGLAIVAYLHFQRPAAAASTPQSRNDQRRHDLALIGDALVSYESGHGGKLPVTIGPTATDICSSSGLNCSTAGHIDLSFLTSGTSLTSMPTDPVGGRGLYTTGFTIRRDPTTSHLILAAPRAEAGTTITLTR